jgi:hypothetical protein
MALGATAPETQERQAADREYQTALTGFRTFAEKLRLRGEIDRQHQAWLANAFVAEAKKSLLELFGDDPKSNSDYSRIINARTVDRLASLIDPAKVIAGGKSDRDAHYLDPTLLYPITWDDKIMEDEIFGPILPILTYKSFDEAMARMAKPGRPLAGFIFSRDQKVIDRFIGELSFGGGGVNLVNVHLFVDTMPFGGTGSAGMGHYYGKFGFDALTHAKSILISPPDVAIDHLYSPFTDEKNRALQGWFEYWGARDAGRGGCRIRCRGHRQWGGGVHRRHEGEGFVKVISKTDDYRILGVHMIGPQVSEFIGEVGLAMQFHVDSEDVARTCHPHPTQSEALRQAAMGVDGWMIQA